MMIGLAIPSTELGELTKLSPPRTEGPVSVERALVQRRTHRSFSAKPLSLAQLGQLLWAADGVSVRRSDVSFRTAPSAGALFPVDLVVVVGDSGVSGLSAGVYDYQPEAHALVFRTRHDQRAAVARLALNQTWLARAPVLVVVTGAYQRCAVKYGNRAERYTHLEAGHVAQNVYLQAEALGLVVGEVGAFEDGPLGRALHLPATHAPLLLLAVGVPGPGISDRAP